MTEYLLELGQRGFGMVVHEGDGTDRIQLSGHRLRPKALTCTNDYIATGVVEKIKLVAGAGFEPAAFRL